MNLFQIISEISNADPEALERINDRRSALSALGDITKKLALAAAPVAIGAAFNKTLAQGAGSSVNSILNYALSLERLEAAFYTQALAAPTLASAFGANAALRAGVDKIRADEQAHVDLLAAALGTAASPAPRGYNFTAAYANIPTFLTFAQAFEDLGVRAYKGQAGYIPRTAMANVPNVGMVNVLQTALQIHAVEARHASYIRYQRRMAANASGGSQNQFGWITLDQANGAPAAVYGPGNPAAMFPSEANTTQNAAINLTTMGTPAYTAAEISESFDEPLDHPTVLNIASPYIIP
ncbi:hypothetical protein GCM10023185_41180 [Hymenobacter saemangeumensis]|uniref:Ferritin-like domain-containing protein n=1 Tax=Hymenobacter saemangeumensis TaxID=1084522 RepID=A0ABP8IR92_9BACT